MNGSKWAMVPIVLLILTISLAGCGSGSSLEGTQWLLVSLGGETPLTSTAPPSAEFSSDEISGSTGCNHYFGAYEASGTKITIRDVASTEMACMDPQGVMDQEQTFLAALRETAGYNLAGDRLEFLDTAGNVRMVFEAAPASP